MKFFSMSGNGSEVKPGTVAAPSLEERWATVGGARMRYIRGGEGAPLIFLHGLWGYSFSWRRNVACFAERFTVFAVDMIGAGYSDRPPGMDWSLAGQTRRMLEFMDAVGIESADIVASSHGGAIAMMIAIASQAEGRLRVARLVLVAPVNPWSHYSDQVVAICQGPLGAVICAVAKPFAYQVSRWSLRGNYSLPHRIPAGTIAGYTAPLSVPGLARAHLGILRSWRKDKQLLNAGLHTIADVPLLLLWGTDDKVLDIKSAEPLMKNFHRACLVKIDGAGHLPFEEMPAEFNRVLMTFLEQQSEL